MGFDLLKLGDIGGEGSQPFEHPANRAAYRQQGMAVTFDVTNMAIASEGKAGDGKQSQIPNNESVSRNA